MTSALMEAVKTPVRRHGRLTGGLYTACVTPFGSDEQVDTGALRSVIDYLFAGGVTGLTLTGTTGEAHALDFDERRRVWATGVKAAAGRGPILAGCGATTTREAKRLVALAADCGCDAALVLTPWYENATHDAIARYYADIAADAKLPILLYHNPSRTHLDWPAAKAAEVARRLHGPVIGMKDSTNDARRVAELRAGAPADFLIFSGGPHQRAAFAAAGADGCIDGPSNVLPREGREAYDGDEKRIAYFGDFYKVVAAAENDIALMKAVMRALGLPAGKTRAPNDAVPEAEYERAKKVLQQGGRLYGGDAGRPTERQDVAQKTVHLFEPALEAEALAAEPVPARHATLWRPEEGEFQYSHHACIAHFGGQFFAAWSNARLNEDSPGQLVRFATSKDGAVWSEAQALTAPPEGMLRWTAGGFWVRGGKLLLNATRYTRARYVDGHSAPGKCWADMATEHFEWDGAGWRPLGPLCDDFYVNEAPRQLPDGRFMMTGVNDAHDALVAVSATGKAMDWTVHCIAKRTSGSPVRLTEPSWFAAKDGRIRVLLRDDGGSRRIWISESADGGNTWSPAAPTDLPDGQSKFFALTLPDGRAAFVSNATGGELRRRFLSVALSGDGNVFTRLRKVALDANAAARFPGMHKARGFQYPNACIVNGRLWVINSVNKEDIELRSIATGDL